MTMKLLRRLLLVYILLSAIDTLFTVMLIHAGYVDGQSYSAKVPASAIIQPESLEANPIVGHILKHHGIIGMLIYKLCVMASLCMILPITHFKYPRISVGVIIVGNLFQTYAVILGFYSYVTYCRLHI